MFGRENRLPADLVLGDLIDRTHAESVHDFVAATRERQWSDFALVREYFDQAAKRRTNQYDDHVNPMSFQPGQLVWHFCPRRRQGLSPKWQNYYVGPYRVLRLIDTHNVVIQKSKRAKCLVVHKDELKACFEARDLSEPNESAVHGKIVPGKVGIGPVSVPASTHGVDDSFSASDNTHPLGGGETDPKEHSCDSNTENAKPRPKRNVRRPKHLNNYVVGAVHRYLSPEEMLSKTVEFENARGTICGACGRRFKDRHGLKYHLQHYTGDEWLDKYAKCQLEMWPKPGHQKDTRTILLVSQQAHSVCTVTAIESTTDLPGPSRSFHLKAHGVANAMLRYTGQINSTKLMKLVQQHWPKLTSGQERAVAAATFRGLLCGLQAAKDRNPADPLDNHQINDWLNRAAACDMLFVEQAIDRAEEASAVVVMDEVDEHVNLVAMPELSMEHGTATVDGQQQSDGVAVTPACADLPVRDNERVEMTKDTINPNPEVVESGEGTSPISWDGLSPQDEELLATHGLCMKSVPNSETGPTVKASVPCSLTNTPPFWVPAKSSDKITVEHSEGKCLHVELKRFEVPLPTMNHKELQAEVLEQLECNEVGQIAESLVVTQPAAVESMESSSRDATMNRTPSKPTFVTPGMKRAQQKPLLEAYFELLSPEKQPQKHTIEEEPVSRSGPERTKIISQSQLSDFARALSGAGGHSRPAVTAVTAGKERALDDPKDKKTNKSEVRLGPKEKTAGELKRSSHGLREKSNRSEALSRTRVVPQNQVYEGDLLGAKSRVPSKPDKTL